MNERLDFLSKKALSLPLFPGVYIMHDKSGKIIYVGKAKKLKNRVSQYFRAGADHLPKVQKMVDNVYDFEYIVCTTEFEALVLEASLIKQNMPKYNILLKDDKGYHYIKITKPPFRRITSEVQKINDGATYLGPFTSGFVTKNTVDEVCKTFTLPRCSKKFPDDYKKSRPCLNYSIGICCAPCAGEISASEYEALSARAVEFLKGNTADVLEKLERDMETAAENLEFERAARLRDRITAIRNMNEKQHIVASKVKNQDVVAFETSPAKSCFEVFRFDGGKLFDREEFLFDTLPDNAQTRADFILQYYSLQREIPKQVTVDVYPEDGELLEKWLCEKGGKSITVHCPQRGEQLELVNMCRKNARERLVMLSGKTGRQTAVLDELAKLCGLESTPRYIESYDISHTAGDENVAGMVVFKDAKPLKRAYKRFKIKSFSGQDDYASMAEVISRRFSEYKKLNEQKDAVDLASDRVKCDATDGNAANRVKGSMISGYVADSANDIVTDAAAGSTAGSTGNDDNAGNMGGAGNGIKNPTGEYTEGFGKLPDLILLDGGTGQLSAVKRVMEQMNISLPIFGMVKDGHHKTRALVSENGEIQIKAIRQIFTLITQIQDEVHRFAIEYHRSRRSKKAFSSSLTEIEGIGKTRAKNLLKEMGSIEKIKAASVEQLSKVTGMNMAAAENIKKYFSQNS